MEQTKSDRLKEKSGKELIIWKAYQVFREKGYHHTTMADLGEASGLLKGSIYHYFPSKEELMKQVLETAYLHFREHVFGMAFQAEASPKENLKRVLDKMDTYFFEQAGGCLMGNIGLETAGRTLSFTQVILNFFEEWIEVFAYLFKAHYEEKEARELARQAVGEIQGSIMLSCIFRDKIYFSTTCKKIMALLS